MSNISFIIIYPYGELNPVSIIRPQTETAKFSALALPLVSSYQIYTYLLLIVIFIERCQLTTYLLDITDFLCSPAPHLNFLSTLHYQISNLKSFYTYMHIYIYGSIWISFVYEYTPVYTFPDFLFLSYSPPLLSDHISLQKCILQEPTQKAPILVRPMYIAVCPLWFAVRILNLQAFIRVLDCCMVSSRFSINNNESIALT